jgi:hypothetical protein
VKRPVHDADPVQVARADHDVVLTRRGRERGEILGPVREIRVHLTDQIRAVTRERALQPLDVRSTQPALTGAVQHIDPARVLDAQAVGEVTRAIRRRVVDDEHPKAVVREHATSENGKILSLVKGRNDDEHVWRTHGRG